jgi:cytochrome P450
VQLLFEHPDERARLMADMDALLPSAVEEMLRYTSPVAHFQRTVMADTVVRGVPLAAGDRVVLFYGAANRDEDVFVDPDRFDVGRNPNPHVAFGAGGPHLCLGLHVARIEIVAMLRELLTRMPDLAPAAPLERLASSFIAGVRTMPVRFTPGPRTGVGGGAQLA